MANKDPSPANRFEAGQSGNPGGKTKAQREAEVQAAEDSAILRAMMTRALLEAAKAGADMTQYIDAATLKLFKDSEDRGHGTPMQTVDNTSSDGSMTPQAPVAIYKLPENGRD